MTETIEFTSQKIELAPGTCAGCGGEGQVQSVCAPTPDNPEGVTADVCDTCAGSGVKYPPTCSRCGTRVGPVRMSGGDYWRCPTHPQARIVRYAQVPVDGYPEGWPLCACGRPALDGKVTCGEAVCGRSAG